MQKWLYILFFFNSLFLNAQGIINNGAKIIINSENYLRINGNSGNYKNQNTYSNNGTVITNGTLSIQGNWINNTPTPLNLISSNGTIVFNGINLQSINGINDTYFKNISIDNPSGIFLNSNISACNNIEMIQGNLDLRNFTLNLGSTGTVLNESENKRIKASDGINEGTGTGSVIIIKTINAGNNINLGGLGIDINAKNNIGKMTIERKHTICLYKGEASIARYFIFSTKTGIPVNAVIRMYYFGSELNGQDEEKFAFWNSEDNGINWSLQYPTVNDTVNNYVEKTGVFSMSRWTIGIPFADGVLPIELLSFNGSCTNNMITIKWATASETNNDFFTLERSADAINFIPIAVVKGAGNSNTNIDYEIIDTKPPGTSNYYRLKQTDFDGKYKYFPVKSFDCNNSISPEVTLLFYPNPFQGIINFKVSNLVSNNLQIKIYDALGRIVAIKQMSDLENKNQDIKINLSQQNSGAYYFIFSSGDYTKSGELIKN